MDFETVIGLETHVQLSTNTKIFSGSSAAFGADPNENIDPVTLGLPGALPVPNRKVIEFAIMVGLATGCEIRRYNRFARKHYFYPDLPKGYQISQFDEPICERGKITIQVDGIERTIGIKRIHMEEDAGKNMHDGRTQCSLVDLNRAGVPLLEIVSEPDIRSPAEAGAYLRAIRQLVRFLGVSDGNMEEGSLRCDANISLRPVGELKFGTRTEIKNLNSFKFVERGLEYEVARQSGVLRGGGRVVQETLSFDSATGTTRTLRSKEEAADYRYLPDPDLPPVIVEERWVRDVQSRMPRLPHEAKKYIVETLGLTSYDAEVLTAEKSALDYFEEVYRVCANARAACTWLTSELFGYLNKNGLDITKSPVAPHHLGALIKLLDTEVINGKMAKSVFEEMFATQGDPEVIVKSRGLQQITNEGAITEAIAKVFNDNPGPFADFVGGNDRLLGFFVGLVMKATGGSANPKKVNELINKELVKRRA
jgi:aspartyl-tRNA(Asn)/glutamyl-tRNA(Gln) amidotransferase subunit B